MVAMSATNPASFQMHRHSLPKIRIAIFLIVMGCCAGGRPSQDSSRDALNHENAVLPDVFVSALAEVKTKTHIPVLLPTELPKPFNEAKSAEAEDANTDEYAISLFYESGIGYAGFAGSFSAKNKPDFNPKELPNVHETKLAHGTSGFFRPVSCGRPCAPANLWWSQEGILYQIQLQLSSTLRISSQEKILTRVADSAILAGPR